MIATEIASSPWIIRSQPNPQARLRLFCLPFAGGGASLFRTWWTELPTDVEICSVQLPGRENRLQEPSFTRLAPLLEHVAHVLQPYLHTPFALFGHSVGALISFELAHYLRAHDLPTPAHLFVSAHRAPHLPRPAAPIHRLPDSAFVEEVRRFNGTSEAVLHNAELMRLALPTLRADLAIAETYAYATKEPLDCPISAFGGRQDPTVRQHDIASWRTQTHRPFVLRMFPGNHFFLQESRTPLLRAISQDLARTALVEYEGV